jgi:predicted RNase H-like nuclease (RuvC/YqgF family)
MTSDMTIRDPETMERFAKQIDEYVENMKANCKKLSSSIASAAPYMRDEQSKKAFAKIEMLSVDLLKGLKEAMEAADKLRAAAKPLREAQKINF